MIDHQDVLIAGGRENHRLSSAELRSTADVKIHIYEKALANIKALQDRETLLLGLMSEGSKIWDITEQSVRWENISQSNINSLLLWKRFLDFKLTNFSSFRFEDVRDIFLKRISHLSKTIEKPDSTPDAHLSEHLILALLMLTIFLRECGYLELAITIWQVLLELNFFAPVQAIPPSEVLKIFQEFWESEVPRIGEAGALGWRHFVATNDTSAVPDPEEDPKNTSIEDDRVFTSWVSAERLKSRASRRPARTLDDVAEDDPFRVILFSDIEPFAIHIEPLENHQKFLLDAFLVFCHLPPLPRSSEGMPHTDLLDSIFTDQLLHRDESWLRKQYNPRLDTDSESDKDIASILRSDLENFAVSPSSLYNDNWFRAFWAWCDIYADGNDGVAYSFIQNALKQLLDSHFRIDLAEYYLSFTRVNEPHNTKKTSKRLLKQHSTSLRLYDAYAMIEWSQGNKEVAVNTYTSILNMAKTLPEDSKKDSIYLWISWIWGCLEDGDHDAALRHLLSIPDDIPNENLGLSPATLLRCRQHLSINRDLLLSSANLQHSVSYAEGLALLEYLTSHSNKETQSINQGDIAAAMEAYTSFSATLIARNLTHTTAHELLLQSATRLLYLHAQKG